MTKCCVCVGTRQVQVAEAEPNRYEYTCSWLAAEKLHRQIRCQVIRSSEAVPTGECPHGRLHGAGPAVHLAGCLYDTVMNTIYFRIYLCIM